MATLDPVTADDENWKAFASYCIAALFEILNTEKRTLKVSRTHIEEIRMLMGHKLCALGILGLEPTEDGMVTFSTMHGNPNEKPN